MNNNDIAISIENQIRNKVMETLSQRELPELPDNLIATDNLGEVIEKLCILHIRTWFLEDMVGVAQTDAEIAALKKKIDICFKQKRPQYIQAINRMIDDAVLNGRNLSEDSVKIYKGN
jgi:nitrogen regulatory protein PII-like uncharacterized protein